MVNAIVQLVMKGKLAHSVLRQFVLTLLLLSSVLPSVKTVFACDLMGGKMQTVCCCKAHQSETGCKMGGGCSLHNDTPASDCCKVSHLYQPLTSASALPEAQAFQSVLHDVPQPQAVLLSMLLAYEIPVSLQSGSYSNLSPPWRSGAQTYLLTNRLRI